MEIDYPASHSMDTWWFAVDELGHVAVFNSGEEGHVPRGAEDGAMDLMDALEGKEDDSDEDWEDRVARLGLFFYSYNEYFSSPVVPYERGRPPKQPLHVDQLPPELRQRVRTIRFKNMDFFQQELLQPLEQYECNFWYEDVLVAYLASDGKTVRPLPGKEKLFADFCIDFQKANPKEAKKYQFQAPQPEKRKTRRRRKENHDGQ